MKRRKADPRQLCFVFDESSERAEGDVAKGDMVSEPFSGEKGIAQPAGSGRQPENSDQRAGTVSVYGMGEVSTSNLGKLSPKIADAYRNYIPHSGSDPALTSLCVSLLQDLGMYELAGKIKVVWNRRFTSAAGVARYSESRIELNPALVQFEGEVDRTLRHELAHLVALNRYPNRRIAPHGSEWRQACADLGIPGEGVYHNLPFKTRRQKRKYAYRCRNCAEVVTRVRPLKGHCACYVCCKRFNRGRYHSKFRLERVQSQD